MKVILLADVQGLGKAGEVKEVRTGYGFNFLLPEGLVELATPQALKHAEKRLATKATEKKEKEASLEQAAKELSGKEIVIKHKEKDGKLFGSVGKAEIAKALKENGIEIDEKVLKLEKPIKEVGVSQVSADFGHGIKASFTITVEAE